MNEPLRANEGIFANDREPAPDINDPWVRMERWLDEDPENNWIELQKHRGRWGLRMMQEVHADPENPDGHRCVADVESTSLEGAVAGALLLAREFKEGMCPDPEGQP